ncbi:unnamed protein product [Spirodela intermedia]|uniref:Uncharacterized protein n=2 Tax=Spirodela intermedia TaxID=51605 RepID=A0A7I8IR11_SPIIN|nr:unnamed protein product [Spirodela intermedia]CAA6660301.1 unnamed protein product [Spirodela intermedia]CAA7396637.1 unnamed protein product [Spirodela intermedia]
MEWRDRGNIDSTFIGNHKISTNLINQSTTEWSKSI